MSGKLNLILGRADTGKTARVVAALNIGAPAAHASAEDLVTRYLPALREVQAALRPVLA